MKLSWNWHRMYPQLLEHLRIVVWVFFCHPAYMVVNRVQIGHPCHTGASGRLLRRDSGGEARRKFSYVQSLVLQHEKVSVQHSFPIETILKLKNGLILTIQNYMECKEMCIWVLWSCNSWKWRTIGWEVSEYAFLLNRESSEQYKSQSGTNSKIYFLCFVTLKKISCTLYKFAEVVTGAVIHGIRKIPRSRKHILHICFIKEVYISKRRNEWYFTDSNILNKKWMYIKTVAHARSANRNKTSQYTLVQCPAL